MEPSEQAIPESELQELRLSVGTHAARRLRSPEQVAQAVKRMLESGMPRGKIAEELGFHGTTMLGRFLKILQLPEGLRYQVGWSRNDQGSIPFSSASYLIRLPEEEQRKLAKAIAQHRLTRLEIQSVVQLFERSGDSLDRCVERVVRRKRETLRLEVFFGSVDSRAGTKLSHLAQSMRDRVLRKTLEGLAPELKDVRFQARLGVREYLVAGGEEVAKALGPVADQIGDRLLDNLKAEGVP